MVDLDLMSIKRFTDGAECQFVLDVDWTAMHIPLSETDLRAMGRDITERLTPTGNRSAAQQWVRTPKYWSAILLGFRDLDDIEEWLLELATALGRLPGRIIGGPRDRMQTDLDPRLAITGFLYLSTSDLRLVDRNDRGPFWGVDDTTTLYVAERMLHWTHLPRGREHITRGADWTIETVGLDHAPAVAEFAKVGGSLELRSAHRKPFRANYASLIPNGDLGIRVVDYDQDWQTSLKKVQEILTWTPPRSDYGYLRLQSGAATVFDQGRTWPHIDEMHVRYNRPLIGSFVPDAFGVQLLTDAHLERAHDLSDWDVTPLNGGRHLVAARDLEPWLKPSEGLDENGLALPDLLPADADLVVKARADFGDMILTPELIEAHDPWR